MVAAPILGIVGEREDARPVIESLEARVASAVLHASHARLVELAAEALEAGLWCQSGIHSAGQWLVWQVGCHRRVPARS